MDEAFHPCLDARIQYVSRSLHVYIPEELVRDVRLVLGRRKMEDHIYILKPFEHGFPVRYRLKKDIRAHLRDQPSVLRF